MAGASILATICAERLTKFVAHYTKVQSMVTRHNSGQAQRLFPSLDALRRANIPAPMDRKYVAVWQLPEYRNKLRQTSKCLKDACGPVPKWTAKKDQTSADNSKWFNRLQQQATQARNLRQATLSVLPKTSGIVQAPDVQQKRMYSTSSQYKAATESRRAAQAQPQGPGPSQRPVLAHYAFAGTKAQQFQSQQNNTLERLKLYRSCF